MIERLQDVWRVLQGKPLLCRMPSMEVEAFTVRSSQWRRVRNDFVDANPFCELCGTRKELEVHHIQPVHLFPKFELEWWNLITLCRDHHFEWGHLGDWRSYNITVKDDVAWMREKRNNRP